MDTETGSVNISQDAQQKIMRLRYLALYDVGTHIQQFTEKSFKLISLSVAVVFMLVYYVNFSMNIS
jgi:hypothetical protein